MKMLKEWLMGFYLVSTIASTVAYANHEDIITRLAIENATIQPDVAIATVTSKYKGKLKEFELEDHDDKLVYEISLIDAEAGEEIRLEMSAESGEIIKEERSSIGSWFSRSWRSKEKYQRLQESEVTLQDAVAKAQKIEPGVLMEVELEQEKGVVFFEVKLITNKGKRKVIVDLTSGKPIPVTKQQ